MHRITHEIQINVQLRQFRVNTQKHVKHIINKHRRPIPLTHKTSLTQVQMFCFFFPHWCTIPFYVDGNFTKIIYVFLVYMQENVQNKELH